MTAAEDRRHVTHDELAADLHKIEVRLVALEFQQAQTGAEGNPDQTLRRLVHAVLDRLEVMTTTVNRIDRKGTGLMALSAEETAAIQDLSDDIDTALAAATSHDGALQTVIDDLTAQLAALSANDATDQQTITDLTAARDALQAALDAHSADVVSALTTLDQRVESVTPPA